MPSDHGDGDVKLGAGKGAHDLPSSAAVGSPALLLCDACQCLGSLAMTWLLGFWVVVSSGSHKKIVGCFRSLGCFLDWFFPQGPVYEFPIWSARIVKRRRVKGIRKGWKRRLHERCRALHTLSPCVRFGQPSKDEKGAGKQNQSKGGAKGKKSAEDISKESDWTLVGRKGKPQPPLSFSNDKSEFRLRESDWQGYTIVPRVQKLGAILDSDKKSDPLVILVFTSQELVNLLQMIQGEKGIRITVLCPCKKGDTITVDGFPNIHFEEKRYPVQDNAGQVLTKIMACWTNGVAFNQHMRIVVPQDRRPTFKPESRNERTTVFRLRADFRYCQEKHWASAKDRPGAVARKWVAGVSPNAVMGVLDSWGWELEPGLGKGSIIKGLIRIKKGQACDDLLNASGRFSNGIRFFLEPLKWEETTLKKQPFISWVEQTPQESRILFMLAEFLKCLL